MGIFYPDEEQDTSSDLVFLAEQAVLGAMMTSGGAIEAVLGAGLEPSFFGAWKHEYIADAVYTLHADGTPADVFTVATEMERHGNLVKVGGVPYLHQLVGAVITTSNASYHAGIVKDAYVKRRFAAVGAAMQDAAHTSQADDVAAVVGRFEADLAAIKRCTSWEAAAEVERMPRTDFAALFEEDFTTVEWLPGQFLERGQQMALVGEGKSGKSLFVLAWVWCAIRGERFLGDTRREPLRVQYWDRENSRADLFHRLRSFGATRSDAALLNERLDYRQFPAFSGSLDQSAAAAQEMLAAVEEFRPDVVILDTVSRFIGGKENDSDTWLALYRKIHVPLKESGVACVRLDHMGKDVERGSRGSSAKTQDVDHVWELTANGEPHRTHDKNAGIETITTQLKLKRTHTRSGLGNDLFWVVRRAQQELSVDNKRGAWLTDRTSHVLAENGGENKHSARVEGYVTALKNAGAPPLGRDKLKAWAGEHGVELPSFTNELADVVSAYKAELAK